MTRDASGAAEGDAGLAAYFTNDHRRCDSGWAEVEGAAESGPDALPLPESTMACSPASSQQARSWSPSA